MKRVVELLGLLELAVMEFVVAVLVGLLELVVKLIYSYGVGAGGC